MSELQPLPRGAEADCDDGKESTQSNWNTADSSGSHFDTPAEGKITVPSNYHRWKRKSFSQGLMEAYHRLGGIEYLVWFGRAHPADFVRACSRMIPQEIRNSLAGEVTIIHAIPRTALDVHPKSETYPSRLNAEPDSPLPDADDSRED